MPPAPIHTMEFSGSMTMSRGIDFTDEIETLVTKQKKKAIVYFKNICGGQNFFQVISMDVS